MALTANEMISHSAHCQACDRKKKGILLDDDERYEQCDQCGGALTDHEARMQRMDDKAVWKDAGPMRWEDGRWVLDD